MKAGTCVVCTANDGLPPGTAGDRLHCTVHVPCSIYACSSPSRLHEAGTVGVTAPLCGAVMLVLGCTNAIVFESCRAHVHTRVCCVLAVFSMSDVHGCVWLVSLLVVL